MSHQSNPLPLKQDKAIAALLTCPTIAEAALQAGVAERSIYRWLQKDDFQSHLRRARRRALSRAVGRLQQVAERAVEALDRVLDDEKATASSRVSAARAALRFACHGIEIDEFPERLEKLERSLSVEEGSPSTAAQLSGRTTPAARYPPWPARPQGVMLRRTLLDPSST